MKWQVTEEREGNKMNFIDVRIQAELSMELEEESQTRQVDLSQRIVSLEVVMPLSSQSE